MWLFSMSYCQCLVPRRKKNNNNKDKIQGAKRSLISSVPWESLHPREEGLATVRGGGQCQNTGLYFFFCRSVINKVKVLVAQLCQILWDSMDFSLPGSSVHGILQARILEWVAISAINDQSSYIQYLEDKVLFVHPGKFSASCSKYICPSACQVTFQSFLLHWGFQVLKPVYSNILRHHRGFLSEVIFQLKNQSEKQNLDLY